MEEIELRELIEILIERKKTIAVITLVSILIATMFSFVILKPTYEAKMVLITAELTNNANTNLDPNNVDDMLNMLSQMPNMTLETYRQQILSPEVLSKTIKDLGLEEDYTIGGLGRSIVLETVDKTNMITIKMENSDPEKAATIVNTLGENFIAFVTEKAEERSMNALEYVESQLDVEKAKYEESLLELKELLSEPRGAQELELELNSSYDQITQYKSNLSDLEIKKDGLVKAIEESKNYSSNRGSVTSRPNFGGNLDITFDDSNKVLAVDLAETEGVIESTKEQIANLQSHIEEIQVEYQDKKYQEDVIRQKVNISKNTYETFVSKYEELKVAETAKVGELSINVVSHAYPPTTPVGPRKALNLAISMVLGLMIGVFVAFFNAYWESSGKDKELIGGENIGN
ncbi:MAG: Wzz/FepE/Etk N-terminal domain-containing protein [Tissierellaceae bacterium]|nr:Wzz/FepE/Etk N-terminal domain-containing protein [Tissierellaceae bacterium]